MRIEETAFDLSCFLCWQVINDPRIKLSIVEGVEPSSVSSITSTAFGLIGQAAKVSNAQLRMPLQFNALYLSCIFGIKVVQCQSGLDTTPVLLPAGYLSFGPTEKVTFL